jgi:hypothetical protein
MQKVTNQVLILTGASLASMVTAAPAPTPTRFETVPPTEPAQIAETIDLTVKLLQQRYPESMARRGVHPKDHGCLQASFTVNPDLPERFRVGVFQPGKSYPAWVRYSNATATVNPDIESNGPPSRGMAIKLMGVEGETLLGESGAKTQDFLLINQPMFAFADVAQYLELTRVQFAHRDNIAAFFAPPLSEATRKTLGVIGVVKQSALGNPTESPYFSASPYLLGSGTVVKFAAKPRSAGNTPVPAAPSPNYLREALKKSMDPATGKEAVFDFQVQIRTSDDLPVEDAATEWKEVAAPYYNVASLKIPPQDFDNPLRITECEHLVFTPWHGLREHQPIGGINRLRLGVYQASAGYRSQPREPSGFPK